MMTRVVIKNIYMTLITIVNQIFRFKRLKSNHIAILMTFPEDVMPIIEQLNQKGYELTVIAKEKEWAKLKQFKNVSFVPTGNNHIVRHIKTISTAKVIVIDTYYLMLGGYHKKKGQTIIQTWHASGALKNFGLTDHQVDLNNKKMVQQYKSVYKATDYYLVGGEEMSKCFESAFDAKRTQMLKLGLPRLTKYFKLDLKTEQKKLKKYYNIPNKLALYVPTYRENQMDNRQIDKVYFEKQLPNYTLINQLHPSIPNSEHIAPTSELIMMADIIISDYSSLPIEASLLNKPTLFYVFDEEEYEEVRGLNQFYRDIPTFYKVKHIDELVTKIKYNEKEIKPLFKNWHKYNSEKSLENVLKFIEKLVKE